jgi:hypothetical protein
MSSCREVEQRWRKSSHSLNDGNCVEVGCDGSYLLARDSKDPHGRILRWELQPWRSFLSSIKATHSESVEIMPKMSG